jgi:hypothetical protein
MPDDMPEVILDDMPGDAPDGIPADMPADVAGMPA